MITVNKILKFPLGLMPLEKMDLSRVLNAGFSVDMTGGLKW